MRPWSTIAAFSLVLAALYAGCGADTRIYRWDRTLREMLPRDRAMAQLRVALARATAANDDEGNAPRLRGIEVGDAGISFRAADPPSPSVERDYQLAWGDLAPEAFELGQVDGVCVSLDRRYVGEGTPDIRDRCIWFADHEQTIEFLDAVWSVKADPPPKPATRPAPPKGPGRCPSCGATYPPDVNFCETDGARLTRP